MATESGLDATEFEDIISTGVDALAFEESKKGYKIDMDEIVDAVAGRCTLFGNLDPYNVLCQGTEMSLEIEIKKQMMSGKRNKGRFIMNTGSPVTPETTVGRYCLYMDMVKRYQKL